MERVTSGSDRSSILWIVKICLTATGCRLLSFLFYGFTGIGRKRTRHWTGGLRGNSRISRSRCGTLWCRWSWLSGPRWRSSSRRGSHSLLLRSGFSCKQGLQSGNFSNETETTPWWHCLRYEHRGEADHRKEAVGATRLLSYPPITRQWERTLTVLPLTTRLCDLTLTILAVSTSTWNLTVTASFCFIVIQYIGTTLSRLLGKVETNSGYMRVHPSALVSF